MIELHARVAKYNTINIAATGVLLVTQFFNLTLWLSWYLLLLDDDTIKILLFWPLLLLFGIIQLNKSLLRKFIHNQNKQMYEANNVNIDQVPDQGSLPADVWAALPVSSIRNSRINASSDLAFFGELNDIGIKYKLDEFNYSITYRAGDDTRSAANISGEALIVELENVDFGADWTVFANDQVSILNFQSKQQEVEIIGNDKVKGQLMYNQNNLAIEKIKSIILSTPQAFDNHGQVIGMFKDQQFIYISTAGSKFKMRLSFIISKPGLEKIIIDQKAQVYRFNQFLVDISRALNT